MSVTLVRAGPMHLDGRQLRPPKAQEVREADSLTTREPWISPGHRARVGAAAHSRRAGEASTPLPAGRVQFQHARCQ
jgi:hypothetical protein